MVLFSPNKYGKTEKENENVNDNNTSRNHSIPSRQELTNAENIPPVDKVQPIVRLSGPYYNNRTLVKRVIDLKDIRILRHPQSNLLRNNSIENNQRQPFLDLTSHEQNVAEPLNLCMKDNNLLTKDEADVEIPNLARFNTETNTSKTENGQIETLNSEAMGYNRNLSPNITAIVNTIKNDVIRKQLSDSGGLPIDNVTLSSIDSNPLREKQQVRRPRKQSLNNLKTSNPKDVNVYYRLINGDLNNKASNKENCSTTKALPGNQSPVATTLDKLEKGSAMKLLDQAQIVPSTDKEQTALLDKKRITTKPMQTNTIPKKKSKASITPNKENSDDSVTSNDIKSDRNAIEAAKTPNDAKLENERQKIRIIENVQLAIPHPSIQSSANMSPKQTYQQQYEGFLQTRTTKTRKRNSSKNL